MRGKERKSQLANPFEECKTGEITYGDSEAGRNTCDTTERDFPFAEKRVDDVRKKRDSGNDCQGVEVA